MLRKHVWLVGLTSVLLLPDLVATAEVCGAKHGRIEQYLGQDPPNCLPSRVAQAPGSQIADADRVLANAQNLLRVNGWRAAELQLQTAARLYQQAGDRGGQQLALAELGFVYYRLGDYTQAKQTLETALRLGDFERQVQGKLNNRLGLVSLEQGDYRGAWWQLTRATGALIGDAAAAKRNRLGLGRSHLIQGNYAQALQQFNLARRLSGDRWDNAAILHYLGVTYLDLGQLDQATETLEEALALEQAVGDRVTQVQTLSQLGRLTQERGDLPTALTYYEEARTLSVSQGLWSQQVSILSRLGEVLDALGLSGRALKYYQEALGYAQLSQADRSRALLGLGAHYRRRGQVAQAEATFQEAISLTEFQGDRPGTALGLSALGSLQLAAGQASKASQTLTDAVDLFETLRPGLTDAEQVSLFERQLQVYGELQAALVEQGEVEAALVISERGRARAFVELIASRFETEAAELETAIADLQRTPTIAGIQQLARAEAATLVQYSIIQPVAELGQPEADLPAPQIYIWVIQPDGAIAFRQTTLQKSPVKSVEDSVAVTRNYLGVRSLRFEPPQSGVRQPQAEPMARSPHLKATSSSNRLNPGLRLLHQLLIEPIADLLPTDTSTPVIVVPQQTLALVPFAALQDAQGNYLIEQHPLSSTPSLQVLELAAKRRQQRPTATGEALVVGLERNPLIVGNPEMPRFAPFPGEPHQPLSPLPGAEAEAQAIAPLLNTKALIGAAATETAVLERMPTASVIHFATHGLYDDLQGLQSAIALAPTDQDDGLLTAAEVMSLELQADLVILSACDTGRGQITGDGVIGL
ncbi:MAG: CHAT domain-containing protein, partial [Cyanobacteria bacterium P01_H01_bin.121]